jgi:hypothetical protein
MPSPFPGMNPWLERAGVWEEFHVNFMTRCQVHLVKQVRPNYQVRIESRLYIHEPPHEARFFGISDAGVSRPHSETGGVAVRTTAAPATARIRQPVEPVAMEKQRYLNIVDRDKNELVAVIELLSPANKYAGPDREQYLAKRREILRSRTHFVELDLLRGGPRMEYDNLPHCDYCGVVSRVEDRPDVGVWPWKLRDPMPSIPVPLRGSDPEALLDLKAILDQVYDETGLADRIYSGPPEPRLAPDDAAWADAILVATK